MEKAKRPDINNNEILKLLQEGLTFVAIAELFECTAGLVQWRARVLGWESPKGRGGARTKKSPETTTIDSPQKMCTRCGQHPVPKKPLDDGTYLTRLCHRCFRYASSLSPMDNDWADVKTAISMR